MRTASEKKRKRGEELVYGHGYTLVELLVAMAITLVVMAGVYKVYVSQQDSYLLQEQVAELQKCQDSKIYNDQRNQDGRVRSIRNCGCKI